MHQTHLQSGVLAKGTVKGRSVVGIEHGNVSGGIRDRRRADLIAEIHRIALRKFSEQGYDQMALKDICAEAGISLRTLFRHFKGKDAILAHGIEAIERRIWERISERPRSEPLIDAYRYAIDEMLTEMSARPDHARLVQRLLQEVPAIRGQYLVPSNEHRTDAIDEELAHRLGRTTGDGQVRLLRTILVIAVVQAMTEWTSDGVANDLHQLAHGYLELLQPVIDRVRAE